MSQNINFLNSIPQKKDFLSSILILLSSLGLFILLTAFSLVLGVYQYEEHSALKEAQSQKIQAEAAFQQVAQAYPLFASDKPLVEQVAEFENTLREKQKHFEELTHTTLRKPFSEYLQTLSQIVPDGLWLTRININQDNNNISISGYSFQPVFVSILMQALQTKSSFSETQFDLFYVKRLENEPYIEFELANDTLMGPKAEKTEKSETQHQSH